MDKSFIFFLCFSLPWGLINLWITEWNSFLASFLSPFFFIIIKECYWMEQLEIHRESRRRTVTWQCRASWFFYSFFNYFKHLWFTYSTHIIDEIGKKIKQVRIMLWVLLKCTLWKIMVFINNNKRIVSVALFLSHNFKWQ